MDLQVLFDNIGRIAEATERIAEAVEIIALVPRTEEVVAEAPTPNTTAPTAAQVFNMPGAPTGAFMPPGFNAQPEAAPAAAPGRSACRPREGEEDPRQGEEAAGRSGPRDPAGRCPTAPPPMFNPALGVQNFQQIQQQVAQQQVAAPLGQPPVNVAGQAGVSTQHTAMGAVAGAPGMMAGDPARCSICGGATAGLDCCGAGAGTAGHAAAGPAGGSFCL